MVFTFVFLFLFSLSDTLDVQSQVKEQAKIYVDELKEGDNEVLNLWAINQLATLNCESLGIIRNQVLQNLPELSKTYEQLTCGQSIDSLLENSLKEFWPATQLDLYDQIVNDEKPLTKDVLGFTEYPFLHLKLLMSGDYKVYYDSEYLNQALNSWIDHIEKLDQNKDLVYTVTLSNLIWAAYRLNEYQIIETYHEEFLNSKLLPLSHHKLRILNAIDYVFYVLGQYDKSLSIQRNHSLPLTNYIGNQYEIDQILRRHGVYLYSLGKYEESKKVYENLYEKSERNNFIVITNLGLSYYKLGFSNKYLSLQLQALEHESQDYRNLLTVYRNLFLYYTNNKDIQSALQYIAKAKEEAAENQDTTELALIDSYLGTFYWSQYRDHEKALENFNAAQHVLSPDNNYMKYVDLLYEKGNIFMRIDSLDKARTEFETGKKLALSKSNTLDYVGGLINLAAIELKDRNTLAARNILDEIKLYSLEDLDFTLLTKYFTVKSEFLYLTNNSREAIKELTPVVDQVIGRAQHNTDSQEGYWSVEEEYLDAIDLMIELLTQSDKMGEALSLLDRFKTINDATLYNSPLIKASKLSEENLAEEKKLNQRLQSLRRKYLNASPEHRFEIKTEIDRVSAMREQILAGVNLNKEQPLPSIWAIQRLIQPNELVLHFTEIGSQLYVSHLTSDNVRIRKLNFSEETKARFSQIGDEIASGKTNLDHLHELYKILRLDDLPDHIKQISVIPDNYLYRIPLEVLPTRKPDSPISYGSAHYLVEDHQFRYFTSLKEFESNRRSFNTATENTFTAFAISDFKNFESVTLPSLPYATVETRNINSVLTTFNDKKIYTDTEATKSAFKQQVGSSRMVHVATHSEVSEQDPLFSTIYLKNPDSSDTLESDQALYAYELFDTPLNSEFIMLNSCSSGSGNYIQGSGIMGISRALRYAGAKSLALNLWSVNDKVASEFATDFYSYLNEGETKSEAIRKAKLNQIKGANANPHFWGAYMMIGNPSPVTEKPTKPFVLYSLLLITIVLTSYSVYSKESVTV